MTEMHARLSASGSSRWLNCTRSLLLEEEFEDKSSIYAEEGSIAHGVAELKATKYYLKGIGPKRFKSGMDIFSAELEKLKEYGKSQGFPELDSFKQMDSYTEDYMDYLKNLSLGMESIPYVAIEKRVRYENFAEGGFGTADCIFIQGETLHVCDLKYGKGVPVSAEENTQLMLYALGAYSEYGFLYPIKKAVLHIIQPRSDNFSSWEIEISKLLEFGEFVKEKSKEALEGTGDFNPGEHCRFCKARATCRARADENIKLAGFTKLKPPQITNEEVGKYLLMAQDIQKWAKDLEDYALQECLAGRDIAGWKAVSGRSNRKISDELGFAKLLIEKGFDEALLYKPKQLETITNLEKLIGKKDFETIGEGFVIKPEGKPTLVVESDKREAISNVVKAKDVFKEE